MLRRHFVKLIYAYAADTLITKKHYPYRFVRVRAEEKNAW
jgi:hypothetical protein